MNCEEIVEKLPWLLNATLEPTEERQVRQHLATCPACRKALEETRLAFSVFAEHVPTEDLVAWAFEETPTLDPGLLERHLATCPTCAEELDLIRASRRLGEHEEVPLLKPRTVEPAMSAVASAPGARPYRIWRSGALAASLLGVIAAGGWFGTTQKLHTLESQLAEVSPTQAAPQPVPGDPTGRGGSRGTLPGGAQLSEPPGREGGASGGEFEHRPGGPPGSAPAVISTDAEHRLAHLEAENQRLTARQEDLRHQAEQAAEQVTLLEQKMASRSPSGPTAVVNTVVEDIPSGAEVTRGPGGTTGEIRIPAGANLVTLILHPHGKPEPGPHTIELADATGRILWKDDHLVASKLDDYPITLSRDLLPAGSYTLRVRPSGGTAAESFPLRVR